MYNACIVHCIRNEVMAKFHLLPTMQQASSQVFPTGWINRSIYHVEVTPDACLSSDACRKCIDTAVSLYSKFQSLQGELPQKIKADMGPSFSIGLYEEK